MAELLRQLEVQSAREQRDNQRVLGDALLLGLSRDGRSEVLGEADQFLGGLAHSGNDSTGTSDSVIVSALSTNRPREIAVSGGMSPGGWS